LVTRRCDRALLIGGLMVYLFSSLSMEAVGRAGGAVVEEGPPSVPGEARDHGWHRAAEYGTAVALVTRAAQREMILPALIRSCSRSSSA